VEEGECYKEVGINGVDGPKGGQYVWNPRRRGEARGLKTRRELKWKRLDNGLVHCGESRRCHAVSLARARRCPTPVRRRVGVALGEQYAFVPCFPDVVSHM
jgi:hypothetical protein